MVSDGILIIQLLSCSNDGNSNFSNSISMQSNFYFILANGFQRTVWQAYIRFGSFDAGRNDCSRNVSICNGTKQTAIYTCFLGNCNGLAIQFFLTGLGICQNFSLFGFQFCAACFKLFHVCFSSTFCLTSRNQEVPGITVFYGNDVAQITQTADFF